MRLLNRVTVVTGAGSGIGKSIATAFSAEGAQVVVADIDPRAGERAASEIGGKSIAVPTDVSNHHSVEALVKRVIELFGKVHVLVNNAAIQISRGYDP